MDKDLASSPHRVRKYNPTLGAAPSPSRIPGLPVRPMGSGGLVLLSPVLRKEIRLDSSSQDATRQIPLVKGRPSTKPSCRVGSSKELSRAELPIPCPLPAVPKSQPWTAANGLAPRKLSAISLTLRRSSCDPPPDRRLLSPGTVRRELRAPLGKEALGRGEVPLPCLQPLPGLPTLPQRMPLGCMEMRTDIRQNSALAPGSEVPTTLLHSGPRFRRCLAPISPLPPVPHPMDPSMTEVDKEDHATANQYSDHHSTDAPPGLADRERMPSPVFKLCSERKALRGQLSAADATMPSVMGTAGSAWPADTRTDAAMSDLVPEPRQKPVVPMKPVSINSNLLGYIGIDTIIEQMRKKTMKTGFDFNIMVVGQSGLGKSTLVNTLFKSQVSRKSSGWSREEKIPKTVEIKAIGHVIEEGGVKMKLTVIDTPGFGDQINNENCWEPIEKYINEQYEKFLKEEVNIARKKRIPDTRVHCCLYFISPTGHSLRPLDLEFMKHLSKVVNIIPVIAKADTMTLEEKIEFKQRVRKELEVNGIEFYPQKEFDEDLEDKTENDKIRQESMPFAVVGSDKEYQVNGKRVLGRKTPWGIIEVENLNHCEFALLRDFVIRTHLQDLKEVTHNIHYETYRAKRLNDNGGLPPMTVETEENHESNL
ncbi:neuronal-specific septin-3 isoform X1 [Alligator sinensis]|uniref:Neuronal-specific septin-3 n=3 Tax=Alligator TaxID=8495 RepID=A0A3Q0H2P5_ALLSI|nr:neuronal-specific septin-3 isoform X1 [Alligator sinensis]